MITKEASMANMDEIVASGKAVISGDNSVIIATVQEGVNPSSWEVCPKCNLMIVSGGHYYSLGDGRYYCCRGKSIVDEPRCIGIAVLQAIF